jgi:membrane protein required for colicin V production
LPDDIEKYFPKKRKPDDDAADSGSAAPNTNEGYSKSARDGLKKQIEKSGAK